MGPPSKKSKDKRAAASKPTSNGVPASGYNPLLGTFHTLDTAPISSAPTVNINGRNRNIDEPEDQNGNFTGNTGVEYDNISNNGSWSGESEDHKDKTSQPSIATLIATATATNTGVDNDKREKIRQKNEKKHQRQKERRAQELHEKCSGYLMSRKLESLSQQLVQMGFSSERATMALILNEGRVEQSVAWLFEGGEDFDNNHENNNNNLKIDISEELARVAEMEIRFNCSKQEVERAVVACEGDLEQAAETLKVQKQEQQPPPAVPIKLEETGGNSRMVSKGITIQKKTDGGDNKEFNYTKSGGPVTVTVEPVVKNVQLLKKTPVEKRWPVAVSGGSTSNPSLASSPLQAAPPPPAKTEPRYTSIGIELKNIQLGSVREPVIMMQRPKSKNVAAAAMSASVADLHPNVVEPVMNMNVSNSNGFSHGPVTTRGYNGINSNTSGYRNLVNNSQIYDPFHYQQQQVPIPQQYGTTDDYFNHFNNGGGGGGMWNGSVGPTITPTLAAASSLGLFSGSTGPSSADWNACDSFCDYKNIDWSLDRLPQPATSPSHGVNGLWMGYRSATNSADIYASGRGGGGGGTATRPPAGVLPNGPAVGSEVSAGGSREWSSPFEEKELFSFPRQFVSSPSL